MKLRHRALRNAQKYVGVTEHPPNSNHGVLIDKWNKDACGLTGVYWCCSFVHGMYLQEGFSLPGGASVGNVVGASRTNGWVVTRPRKGDLVCYEFGEGWAGYDDHIGIVASCLALRWKGTTFVGWVSTVEGNTSSQAGSGSQSNGGGVFRRRRWITGSIKATFVRVPDTHTHDPK